MEQIRNLLPILIIIAVAGSYIALLCYWRSRKNTGANAPKKSMPPRLPKSAPVIPYMEPILINFYQSLKQALPEKYIIYANVALEKLFDVAKRDALCMKGQYADFVIFTPDLMPVLVIDLFDTSIVNLERVNKIKSVSKEILRNSGIPVLDYRYTGTCNIDELRQKIADLLNPLRANSL